MRFLRALGIGLLWALLSPVILVGAVLVGVYGIINYIIQFFMFLGRFFSGKKLNEPFPEDYEANRILTKDAEEGKEKEEAQAQQQPQPQAFIQNNYYGMPGVYPNGMYPGPMPYGPNQQVPYQQPGMPPYGQLPPQQEQQAPQLIEASETEEDGND